MLDSQDERRSGTSLDGRPLMEVQCMSPTGHLTPPVIRQSALSTPHPGRLRAVGNLSVSGVLVARSSSTGDRWEACLPPLWLAGTTTSSSSSKHKHCKNRNHPFLGSQGVGSSSDRG